MFNNTSKVAYSIKVHTLSYIIPAIYKRSLRFPCKNNNKQQHQQQQKNFMNKKYFSSSIIGCELLIMLEDIAEQL